MKKLPALLIAALLTALPSFAQGPYQTGLRMPTRLAFSPQGNLLVSEAGTTASNSGRVSIVERSTSTRRTLIEGLPSGLNASGGQPSPSGASGVASSGSTIYITIGTGDAIKVGPVTGSEEVNATPSSPIFASLLSVRFSNAIDITSGGFLLLPGDHARLKAGESVTLTNDKGETAAVRLVADFPDYTAAPRPDFAQNVRAGNPFGVVVKGDALYVVDASQNLVRKIDANSGSTTTLSTIGAVSNPLPIGGPFTDAVPDAIRMRGDELLIATLTGFPFPAGRAEVKRIDQGSGTSSTVLSGLTTVIDIAPLGTTSSESMVVLEFSTNMLSSAPGRLLMLTATGERTTIAENLPHPSSVVVDQKTGEIFVSHIFSGLMTRIAASATIPRAAATAVIPVVGSHPGAYGSYFRTSLQIANPHPFPISGQLVVHRQGVDATPNDPAVSYSLAPFESRRYADFMSTAGVSGGGSVDVQPGVGDAPVTVATIVNEGAAGMPLAVIPQVQTSNALVAGSTGTLIAPSDNTSWRFNVGIRTLNEGAALTLTLHNATGSVIATKTLPLPPNYFQQYSAASFFGSAIPNDAAIAIAVTSGSAVAYGAGVNNATGASVVQIARAVTH